MGPLVQTQAGLLRGAMKGDCAVFRNVPYAAPPVGKLRFQPAQPALPWGGERDASRHGPIAPQNPSDLRHFMGDFNNPQGEDCLTLTVWTPATDGARRPVLLWLHGGAFVSGAGSLDWYSGATLAAEGDVVVVHANYRLGALGWLHWPGVAPGNMALSDQAMALRWVRDNIAAFGGDPACITLGGQSAGANATARLMLDPALRPLVRRVLLQSGGFGREPSTPADTEPTSRAFLQALAIDPDGTDVAARLQTVDDTAILRAQAAAEALGFTLAVRHQAWRPLLTERMSARQLLGATASALAGMDVLIGVTCAEGHAFIGGPIPVDPTPEAVAARFERMTGDATALARYRATLPGATGAQLLAELQSDLHFVHPALDLAERADEAGANVHAYLFDWAPPASPYGAGHCIDLAFVFGTWPGWAGSPMLHGADSAVMDDLSAAMRRTVAQFVTTGVPQAGTYEEWPTYRPGRMVMRFGRRIGALAEAGGLLGRRSAPA